ncbi:MAG: succinate dehydrogenase cytochrome b subunit [Melioribacteraceae bacterium]|nr:succinate dehydrogenase cytochrome b subunit [Melioribacteraceae bacterium]
MSWLLESLNSSIGKKILMAVTGISLILFLVGHLSGNMALFANDGGKSFNAYAEFLHHLPGLMVIEIILASVFLLHILNALRLWVENKKARPVKYAVNASSKNSTIFSRTMVQTGSIILIFLIVHLKNFWYEYVILKSNDNLFEIVVETFKDPVYSGLYILAMILLGFHLNHGFQSAFQTFGWNHKKYTPFINFLGAIYSIAMAVGFASMPIYFLFFYGGN